MLLTTRDPLAGYHSNFDAEAGSIPISDALIASAKCFDGWTTRYLQWPKSLWLDPENGVPCHDPEKNAFHIAWLAWVMRRSGQWLGRPLLVNDKRIVDGNHRYRAVQWLATRGVFIEIPVRSL